jgi:Fur family ferric uptake transcriptional regulator
MKHSFSPIRKKILEYVSDSDMPVRAHDILTVIKEPIAFSTVYRALWYLEENNLVEGLSLSCEKCGKDRYYISRTKGHLHFFHCDMCHSFNSISECILDRKKNEMERKYGFRIDHHSLSFSGLCSSCLEKNHVE